MELLFPQPKIIKSRNEQLTSYRHSSIRYLVLVLIVVLLFSNEYCFNNPQALQSTIEEQLQINQAQFNRLYTIIAIPNIFFAIFIGIIIDHFGIRTSYIIFSIGLPVFQIIVAAGAQFRSYSLMLAGRFLFGIVNQSLIIAQACYISKWFMGKELAFALGLATALPELGNAFNSFFSPLIFQKSQILSLPLFVSSIIATVGLLCSILVTYLDLKADQIDKLNNVKLIAEKDQNHINQKFKISDIKHLSWSYWLIVLLCSLAIAQYIPFLDNANNLLVSRFCFSQVTAGKNVMITYIVVGLFAFPVGWLIQKVGFKRYFILLCMIIFPIGQLIILLYPQCQQGSQIIEWCLASWGLFLIGIGYCLYANSLIPSIPLIVHHKMLGTAFGIMQMLQNISMAIFPTITGLLLKNSNKDYIAYRFVSLFFVVTGLIGILMAVFLFFIPEKYKNRLDQTSQKIVMKIIKNYNYETDNQVIKNQKNNNTYHVQKGFKSQNETQHNAQLNKQTDIKRSLIDYHIQLSIQ